jgi:hypothetical protein
LRSAVTSNRDRPEIPRPRPRGTSKPHLNNRELTNILHMNTSVRRVNSERAPVGRSIRHNDVSAVEADQVCVAGRHHFETVLLDTIRAAHLFHELSKCIRSSGVRDKLAIVKARRPATKTPYLQGSERKAGEIKAIARIGLKSSTFAILIHMAYEHFLNGGVRTVLLCPIP